MYQTAVGVLDTGHQGQRQQHNDLCQEQGLGTKTGPAMQNIAQRASLRHSYSSPQLVPE